MTRALAANTFELPENLGSQRVLSELTERFNILHSPPQRVHQRYYDTFDWRLFRRGLALVRHFEEYHLFLLDDLAPRKTCVAEGRPRFWRDFPEGPLRDDLADIIGVRAVRKVGEIGLLVVELQLLNKDEKTVARARIEETESPRGVTQALRTIRVQPVRGYEGASRKLAAFLGSIGLTPTTHGSFEVAVQAQGHQPGDYNSKLSVALDAGMTAQQAAAVIFGCLLVTMRKNVAGICEDIDTEFLHDFRVSVRRTRSALSLMRGVLPKETVAEFRARFSELGRASNRLRDLDVYLLNQESYYEAVDPDLRPGLAEMFRIFAEERKREHTTFVEVLENANSRTVLEEWRATIRAFGTPPMAAPRAHAPVISVSNRLIMKRHRKVVRMSSFVSEDTPDERFHELRIECKKLRYLLEFFSSLYPPDEIGALIKQLKRLQDNLGEFNDLSVQRAELNTFLSASRESVPVETGAAVGALISSLGQRKGHILAQVRNTVPAFATPENERRFRNLFGN